MARPRGLEPLTYRLEGKTNPFVEHPELADLIADF